MEMSNWCSKMLFNNEFFGCVRTVQSPCWYCKTFENIATDWRIKHNQKRTTFVVILFLLRPKRCRQLLVRMKGLEPPRSPTWTWIMRVCLFRHIRIYCLTICNVAYIKLLTYYTPTALVLQLFFESSFCPILLIVGVACNKTKCENSLPLLCAKLHIFTSKGGLWVCQGLLFVCRFCNQVVCQFCKNRAHVVCFCVFLMVNLCVVDN